LIVMLFKPILDASKEKEGIVKEFKHDGGHLNENLGAALNAVGPLRPDSQLRCSWPGLRPGLGA
jgi:hypothetical protein